MKWPKYYSCDIDANGDLGQPRLVPLGNCNVLVPIAGVLFGAGSLAANGNCNVDFLVGPSFDSNVNNETAARPVVVQAVAKRPKLSAQYWKEVTDSEWFKRAHEGRSLGIESLAEA